MLTMISQLTIRPADLMIIFLLMSGLAMLIVILVSWLYAFTINTAGVSSTVGFGVAVIFFVLSKLWMASTLLMVAAYTGVGGGAACAIAVAEMFRNKAGGVAGLVVMLIGALIGAVSLSGSLIAWTKLIGIIENPLQLRGQQALTLVIMVMTLAVGGYIVFAAQGSAAGLTASPGLIYGLLGCALLIGGLITLPFGRTQMPIAIYFYNAFTGLAISLDGFVLRSPTLIVGGMLVGTIRMVLTVLAAKLSVIDTPGLVSMDLAAGMISDGPEDVG